MKPRDAATESTFEDWEAKEVLGCEFGGDVANFGGESTLDQRGKKKKIWGFRQIKDLIIWGFRNLGIRKMGKLGVNREEGMKMMKQLGFLMN